MLKNLTKIVAALAVVVPAFFGLPAVARDNVFQLPIKEAMATPDAKEKLDGTVKFYFGDSGHPAVSKKLGNYITNKKTNAFAKSDMETCSWVLLSALLQMQEKAHAIGADAVINIHSYYKKHDVSSTTNIECHKGFVVAGIALKGDFVKLAGR